MSVLRKSPDGILGFPVAPMNHQGNLDLKALQTNVQFLIDEGLSAIFIGCGSGEFHALDHSEYKAMVETAVTVAGGKVPVYTGVGGNIRHAVELAELSAKLGVDGYLILPPYLIEPEQEGLYEYIKTIVTSTELNAIVYQRDNCIVTVETLQRLVEFPQVVGLKDGHGNMELNMEMTQTIGDRLSWLNGMPMAEVTMPAYVNLGFQAYSSAISNYIPHISALFYHALLNQNKELLSELYRYVILPINRIRKQRKGYAVALIKAGMEIVGLPVGTKTRVPVIEVEKEHYNMLEAILNDTFERFPKGKQVNSVTG
ncbi:5-dehydro-4-deoxyglucarate dehydratase [Paenibacillus arenilitoris]|uniref:Probable 5-dehydro-4-deoxyglucarate dehydratase n=1 Tax=Paenibacillus arenilitoris TaxID=2772299 RepID=A0A927H7X7_9BACL|nr:5-dehydro-4-deoxyglucarate dehydratase [Paenibacillus arenilitoris]MBD2870049.1 5-dehydro-4-deoxyglucarate dehydratase [Paenibacillus arenilitoris]